MRKTGPIRLSRRGFVRKTVVSFGAIAFGGVLTPVLRSLGSAGTPSTGVAAAGPLWFGQHLEPLAVPFSSDATRGWQVEHVWLSASHVESFRSLASRFQTVWGPFFIPRTRSVYALALEPSGFPPVLFGANEQGDPVRVDGLMLASMDSITRLIGPVAAEEQVLPQSDATECVLHVDGLAIPGFEVSTFVGRFMSSSVPVTTADGALGLVSVVEGPGGTSTAYFHEP